jgi:hypothetical protein
VEEGCTARKGLKPPSFGTAHSLNIASLGLVLRPGDLSVTLQEKSVLKVVRNDLETTACTQGSPNWDTTTCPLSVSIPWDVWPSGLRVYLGKRTALSFG